MTTDPTEILVDVIRSSQDLPPSVTAAAEKVADVRQMALDQSYLDFMDEQIRLCARGADWNAILKQRRAALAPHVGEELIDGVVPTNQGDVFVRIDPRGRQVVYWEEWSRK